MSASTAATTINRSAVLARPLCENTLWKDVTPIKQDDGEGQQAVPVVPINYPAHYSDVMDLFRGVLRLNELSPRTLLLTEAVIDINSANYSAWHYRRLCLDALHSDLRVELGWVATVALDTPKNYQLWHHRRCLLEKLDDLSEELATSELKLTAEVLEMDGKNYHAWTHRQWCLKFFTRGLPPNAPSTLQSDTTGASPSAATPATPAAAPTSASSAASSSSSAPSRPNPQLYTLELEYIDSLLQVDIRNNSAWNQRFFIRTLPPVDQPLPIGKAAPTGPSFTRGMSKSVIEEEILYAGMKLVQASHNESPWNYLEGLMKQQEFEHHQSVLEVIKALPEYPASLPLETDDETPRFLACPNRFVQSVLVELWEASGRDDLAEQVTNKLATELDQVRHKYWQWRGEQCSKRRKEQPQQAAK